MCRMKQLSALTSPLLAFCLVSLPGCGTNFNDTLNQAAGATGRTLLDLFLTDFANALADAFEPEDVTPAEDDGGGETPPPDGPPLEEQEGDPETGASIYASDNCTACHCEDAVGGCALAAPSLVGESTESLDDRLRGGGLHAGGKFDLTDQDIFDLHAYLASLSVGGG